MNSFSVSAGNSGAEEKFIQLFCDVFGPEKGQYVYLQFPFCDIYGKHRSIDFAIKSNLGKIAFEVDGRTWHDPSKVSSDKYIDDLLKQNSMIYDGWKVYRWTDDQIEKTPERVKSELITFLGTTPILFLAHTKELVEQGYDNFSKLWPEASCGKYVDDKRDKDCVRKHTKRGKESRRF